MLFRLYDSDGDGCVSRSDVESVVEAVYKMVGPLLAQDTADNKEKQLEGSMDGEKEVKGDDEKDFGTIASERVKEIFQTLDKVY